MPKNKSSFTVYFEDPYWVGVYQRQTEGQMQACKITFGPQPKDAEVYLYLLANWHKLTFGPFVNCAAKSATASKTNPKRMQRIIQKQLHASGVGTKAQQALQMQHEENKAQKHQQKKQNLQLEKQRKFEIKSEKRKEKHRGK